MRLHDGDHDWGLSLFVSGLITTAGALISMASSGARVGARTYVMLAIGVIAIGRGIGLYRRSTKPQVPPN